MNEPVEEIVEPVATPLSTTELPTADSLQNLMAENEYSKTHIRLQKTRPREEKKPVSESTVTQSSTSTTELQNIQEANRYSKTQISKLKIKKDLNAPRDYSNIQIKDIIKQIPVSKLNTLLKKSGYKVSDMFKKVPEVMDLVMKAVEDESFLESQLTEASMAFDPVKEDTDKNDDLEQLESEETNEDTVRMPWAPRIKEESSNNNQRESANNNQRKSSTINEKSDNTENNEVTEDDFESRLEDEVKTMDLKSLMKKISPMSLSEVLQQVGYALPDIMSKNQAAIRAVLKYHYKLTMKEEEKVEKSTKSSGWSPTKADYTSTTTTESTTVAPEETTKKSFRRKSSIDLFQKFRNRLTVETPTTTTEAVNLVTPSSFKFGERTTKKRFTSIDDYRKSLENNRDENDDFATPPITYFDVNGDLVENNIKLQRHAEESLLGDYEIYDYYEDYNNRGPVEVPESVRSALIASSVVGGLAVILFLAIFMLCLWKQMKSKLRMNGEFQEEKVGFFASMFGKKKIKDSAPNGYFNKVGSTTEPNYSTTSSDEY